MNKGQPFPKPQPTLQQKRMAAGCAQPSKAQTDLNINNVRARIFSCGDMWWDLVGSTAKYEVPKVIEAGGVSRTSLFAGSLWIGGYESNNLKIAAMTSSPVRKLTFSPALLIPQLLKQMQLLCTSWGDNIYQR